MRWDRARVEGKDEEKIKEIYELERIAVYAMRRRD